MPSSKYEIISRIMNLVTGLSPKTILDIGIGVGKYGMLFREYLDIWNDSGDFNKREVKIVGVEAYVGYKNPVWAMYDRVYVGNVMDIADIRNQEFDLVFMCDVIEHLEYDEAIELIETLKYQHMIIVTPQDVKEQGSAYGNQYETHKSVWKKEDIPNWKYEVIDGIQIFRNFAFHGEA
jgi:hypothetical protein